MRRIAISPRRRPIPSAFFVSLFFLSLLWAAWARQVIVVDDSGFSFEIPEHWPIDSPLPNRKPNCVRCHIELGGPISQAVFDFASSTHDREFLSCQTCHGGNPTIDDAAHEGDFISAQLSEHLNRCEQCHKVSAKDFRRSAHYQKKVRFDYPICSSCHDNHAVGRGGLSMAAICTVCHGATAEAHTGRGESEIIWRSRSAGSGGNRISVAMLAQGPDRPLSVEHETTPSATRLTVYLATDAQGRPTSTAIDVIDAVALDKALYYVLSCEEGDDALGEDGVTAVERFHLSGGADFTDEYPIYGELVRAHDELWQSIERLRATREQAPTVLEDKIFDTRAEMEMLLHEVPARPDPADLKSAIGLAKELKSDLDRFLSQSRTGAQ